MNRGGIELDLIDIVLLMTVLALMIIMGLTQLGVRWMAQREPSGKFHEVAALRGYMVTGLPGEATRWIKAFNAAYKADPRSLVGVMARIHVITMLAVLILLPILILKIGVWG